MTSYRWIHARAPLRINDIGGWTDTWFAREGHVLNIAVGPAVEVQLRARPVRKGGKPRIRIHAENYGQVVDVYPEDTGEGAHPLLRHAATAIPAPQGLDIEVAVYSPVPAGISAGTSASVCAAILGAFDRLAGAGNGPEDFVRLAHEVETVKLGLQSGVQDQICAVNGGICDIAMDGYPRARVRKLRLPQDTLRELERRLCFLYLGKPHDSSSVHEKVIARLESGREKARSEALDTMAELARRAAGDLERGDLEAYGRAMIENNACQRTLSEDLISPEADSAAGVARAWGASGWKVNGAGGRGGSMTILAGRDDSARRRMIAEIEDLGGGLRFLPVRIAETGLEAWDVS